MPRADRKPFVCLPVAGQSFWSVGQPDARRTALREAAYIRRTKFNKGALGHDFAYRGEDLFMLTAIVPNHAPTWVRRPFLRWKLADEAAERGKNPEEIRAWHICADLPLEESRGCWMDGAEMLVRNALPQGCVAEICGHAPEDEPPHVHILVAPRVPGSRHYGALLKGLEDLLTGHLKQRWLRWLETGEVSTTLQDLTGAT
jgi:hypothetical protein